MKKIARAYNFGMASVRNFALAALILSALCLCAQQAQTPSSVSIKQVKLPKASLWNHFSFQFQAGGGVPPYHWRLVREALPRELLLREDGQIIGTVEEQGQSDFTIVAIDQRGKAQQQNYTLSTETPLSSAWSSKPQVNGQRIDGSIKVSNTTGRDFDLTFVVLAVNDIGRATAIGYQHFPLKQNTWDFELPFGDTLSPGNYVVNVDVVGEEPQSNMIFRSRLVAGKMGITVGP